jgi:hypothetical protein
VEFLEETSRFSLEERQNLYCISGSVLVCHNLRSRVHAIRKPHAAFQNRQRTLGTLTTARRTTQAGRARRYCPFDDCHAYVGYCDAWTLNALLTTSNSSRRCSRPRISDHSAQETSPLRIEDTTKCSRIARGFGSGSISGFAAELKPTAGVGFRANAAFQLCLSIELPTRIGTCGR